MIQTLQTLFIKQFYRLNLGFFIVCFFILFGILNFRDTVYFHYSIMERAYEADVMLLLMGVWLIYGVKCFSFGYRVLASPANKFLCELQALPGTRQFYLFAYLQTSIYLPALLYAFITAGVLLTKGKPTAATIVLAYQFMLPALAAYVYRTRLNGSYRQNKLLAVLQRSGLSNGNKKFNYWLLHYLLHQRKGALLGIKTGSLILLQAMVAYNHSSLNLESVCFVMLALVGVHAILPYYLRAFIGERLRFVRSMPQSLLRRYVWFLLTYALLMLPELFFLLLHLHGAVPAPMLLMIYFVSVGLLCLYSSVLYMPGATMERYMLVVIPLFFLSLLFLAAFPLWYYAVGVFIVSYLLFVIFYERWEAGTIN